MINEEALNRIGQQLGNLGVTVVSLEIDVEQLRIQNAQLQNKIHELEVEASRICAERDELTIKLQAFDVQPVAVE
jgi:chromosome segregation ATPase